MTTSNKETTELLHKANATGPSLLPTEKAKSDEDERARYATLFSMVVWVNGPILGWSLYFLLKLFHSKEANELMEYKLQFVADYQLYYVYIAVFLTYLTSLILMANANGARGPTRLDRPDQHIYQVVGTTDLVLMANEGAYGRFNRAQRGMFNMTESLPLFLVHLLLVAPIFGPLVVYVLVPLYMYGRIQFAHGYKNDAKLRSSGFMNSMMAEHGMAALVGVIIIKSIGGSMIPF